MLVNRIHMVSLLFVENIFSRFNYCFSANFPNKSMDRIYWIIKTTTAANFCARITSQAARLAYGCDFRDTVIDIFILVFHVNLP